MLTKPANSIMLLISGIVSALILAFIVALAYLAICLLLSRGSYTYKTRYPYQGSVPQNHIVELDQPWRFETVPVADKKLLEGILRPPPSITDTHWILYIPGNGSGQQNAAHQFLNRLQSELSPIGFSATDFGFAAWTLRGFDGTQGSPSPGKLKSDYLDIVNYLKANYGLDINKLHIVGFSFGSDIAIQLASDLSTASEAPASLTLLSTQGLTRAKWKMRAPHWTSRFRPPHYYDLSLALKKLRVPTLVVESEDDLLGPVDNFNYLVSTKVDTILLPDGHHAASLEYEDAIVGIAQHIKKLCCAFAESLDRHE